jgi:hypothetical protein
MRPLLVITAGLVLLTGSAAPHASGPVGIYGIIERVVFEPNEQAAERIQVWGAFALVDGGSGQPLGTTAPVRGYLYFKLPTVFGGHATGDVKTVRREWNDLKAVAGTGQAIGFGSWGYIGRFADPHRGGQTYFYENVPKGGERTDLRVHVSATPRATPVTYQTDSGIVKLAATGSRAAIVKQLRAALGK